MVDALVSFAIEKLGDFLVHQVNLRLEVKDDIRWLKEELGLLQATVRNAESRQEEVICLWITTVRDVATDAVDILNRFQDGQASLEQGQGHMHRFLNSICICCKKEAQLYDIGNDIESLKKMIGEIKERRLEYGIDNILAGPDLKQKERTLIRTSAIDKQVDVVGFKDDIQKLIEELNSEDSSLKIISIHGMGGLGKTSLATKLYNSNELRHFGTRAKVCVSNEYTIKNVLKRIIMSFKGPEVDQHISNMDEHGLLQYLPKLLLEQGCYLALIDDIWDINAWNQIKIAFPNQDNGSRIIITTRNKKVAETVDRNIEDSQLNGKVFTCRVHDLVRELAIRKAKEQKKLVIFDSSKHQSNLIHLFEGQRRHAIYGESGEYLKLLEQRRFDALYLHSLVVKGYNIVKVESKEMKLIYTRFKNLTVLDMSSVESEMVPEELGELVHLKFLGLVGSRQGKTIAVPASIGKLKKLQSLWGGSYVSCYTVPKELWELPELRHLYHIFIKISGRLNMGSHQTKLNSLCGIDLEEWIKIDTVNFINLRTLHISDRELGEGRTFESIANLTNLQTFLFASYNDVVISTLKPFSVLNRLKSITLSGVIELSEFCFLPDSIEDLTLSKSRFTEDPMPSLGNLRNLMTLDLVEVYKGNKMVCSKNTFPSLQILRLRNFTNLKELQVEDGALPYLKSFRIKKCEELKNIPVQLERILIQTY
ncbi:hypothetical protein ACET3Z_030196 [Daucus carota]